MLLLLEERLILLSYNVLSAFMTCIPLPNLNMTQSCPKCPYVMEILALDVPQLRTAVPATTAV